VSFGERMFVVVGATVTVLEPRTDGAVATWRRVLGRTVT
jgi:hypothetical protein